MAWTTAVRNLTSEATSEGWAALTISIVLGVDTEAAFDLLTKPKIRVTRKRNRYTEQDIDDISKCREQGMTWTEIAEIFNTTASSLCHIYANRLNKSE